MNKYILAFIIFLSIFLRFYKLSSTPPSLYWDEASLGYNAYSILKSANDEHGKFLPLTYFAAFGDYKPPGYIYAAVLPIAFFGPTEFAIRFPSAFFGVLTVIITYLLAKKLFENEIIALWSSFLLAISPWHLQFSRGAFEGNLGLFFSTLAIFLFIKFAKDKPIYAFPSALFFLAGIYTFTGQRLFVPFIGLVLAFFFRREIIKNYKYVFLVGIIALILFLPLYNFVTKTKEGQLRFNEVSIFKNLEPSNQSIHYRQQDNFGWWSTIIHNRRLFYSQSYLIHYFDAFNPSFLFSKGDVNPRLSIQDNGELYYFEMPLLIAGAYFLVAKKQKYASLIFGWLLVSPLGPATARETPHALRMIHILPTFQLISGFGIYHLAKSTQKYAKFLKPTALIIIFVSLFYYLHNYYVHWPIDYSGEWQYGYKQAVEYAQTRYNQEDHIIVTKNYGRPYIYFLLYMQVDPRQYLKSAQIVKDQFGFIDVKSFDKFTFAQPDEIQDKGRILFITTPGSLPKDAQKLTSIENLSGKTVFEIGEAVR